MKNLIILSTIAVMFIAACGTDKTREFIPGTYVNTAKSEYSIANDTLVIEPAESNNFFIYRKTGFRRINSGIVGKLEFEIEKWNALYDDGTKSLKEIRKGKLITFYPEANKLKVGEREYQKIALK